MTDDARQEPPRTCGCAECRRLDKDHPQEGVQLRLPDITDDKIHEDIR